MADIALFTASPALTEIIAPLQCADYIPERIWISILSMSGCLPVHVRIRFGNCIVGRFGLATPIGCNDAFIHFNLHRPGHFFKR